MNAFIESWIAHLELCDRCQRGLTLFYAKGTDFILSGACSDGISLRALAAFYAE